MRHVTAVNFTRAFDLRRTRLLPRGWSRSRRPERHQHVVPRGQRTVWPLVSGVTPGDKLTINLTKPDGDVSWRDHHAVLPGASLKAAAREGSRERVQDSPSSASVYMTRKTTPDKLRRSVRTRTTRGRPVRRGRRYSPVFDVQCNLNEGIRSSTRPSEPDERSRSCLRPSAGIANHIGVTRSASWTESITAPGTFRSHVPRALHGNTGRSAANHLRDRSSIRTSLRSARIAGDR